MFHTGFIHNSGIPKANVSQAMMNDLTVYQQIHISHYSNQSMGFKQKIIRNSGI